MSFTSTMAVQAAALADDADKTPLSAPSRPWLSDLVVSSTAADDPNRDLLVRVS